MNYNEMLEMIETRISENEITFEQKKSNEHSFYFYSGKLDALYELKKTIQSLITE